MEVRGLVLFAVGLDLDGGGQHAVKKRGWIQRYLAIIEVDKYAVLNRIRVLYAWTRGIFHARILAKYKI
ncbi:MAG: hypothetical protein WA354_24785 [Terracidiphilus sp.]